MLPLAKRSLTDSGSVARNRLEPSSAAAIRNGTRRRSGRPVVMSSAGAMATRMRARVMRTPSPARGRGASSAGMNVAAAKLGYRRAICA